MADIIQFPVHLVDGRYRSPAAVEREIENEIARQNRRAKRALNDLVQATFDHWIEDVMSDLIETGRSERRCPDRVEYDAKQLAQLEVWGKV